MPARLSLTKAQRDALLLLPDTEEAFVRHYSLVAEDIEVISGYRTPETRLTFALQLCVLRYPGRVLRHGEILPVHLLAFIAEQVGVSPDAIGGFARRPQTQYEHLAALRKRFGFSDLADASKAELKQWLAPIALKTTNGHAYGDLYWWASVGRELALQRAEPADRCRIAVLLVDDDPGIRVGREQTFDGLQLVGLAQRLLDE
jgi:Domain of unknown function (DUF4158)